MSGLTEVVIVGAGPYGLSIAAHLRRLGVSYRIFGTPMQNWRTRMPQGMLLKSDGFASNLCAPDGEFTLADYCAERGIAYADEGVPVASETFIAYGEAFQKRFVPDVDTRQVTGVTRPGDRFTVELDDGELISAARVVVGIGISDFPRLPAQFAAISDEYLTHSSRHAVMDRFKGREVVVIGGGSSATDIAALMHEAGASAQIVSRRPELAFHSFTDPATRTWPDRLRNPGTGIGQGWRSVFYTRAPLLFRHLPEAMRLHIVATSQAIAGGWPMQDRVVGKVQVTTGFAPRLAEVRDGRIHLQLVSTTGEERLVSADHAILCTGYRVDLRKVKFLGDRLRVAIAQVANTPLLSTSFETNVPGLYFVGPASTSTFGPMFRFVYGAEYAAPHFAAHLARAAGRRSTAVRPAMATR